MCTPRVTAPHYRLRRPESTVAPWSAHPCPGSCPLCLDLSELSAAPIEASPSGPLSPLRVRIPQLSFVACSPKISPRSATARPRLYKTTPQIATGAPRIDTRPVLIVKNVGAIQSQHNPYDGDVTGRTDEMDSCLAWSLQKVRLARRVTVAVEGDFIPNVSPRHPLGQSKSHSPRSTGRRFGCLPPRGGACRDLKRPADGHSPRSWESRTGVYPGPGPAIRNCA
jgi:hypothetical protein